MKLALFLLPRAEADIVQQTVSLLRCFTVLKLKGRLTVRLTSIQNLL